MKTRHLLAALAALLACAAPSLASNTGITIQIPAAVTSVAASDVTVLDVAGLYLATDVEAALAEARATYETVVDMPLPCPPTVTAYAWDDSKWYVCSAAGDAWNVITHGGTHAVGASDPITANLLESSCDIGVGLASGGPLAGQVCTTFVVPGPATTSGLTLATSRLLGRTTASTGAVEELTVSSPLSLSGGALGLGTLGVSGGGTGATSLTAYAPVCGGTTTTGAVQSCSSGIGNVGYVLTTTGATSLPTWQAASGGGGTPGGSDTQCQFNDGGAFNGAIGCTYNKTTGALTLGDSLRVADNGLLSRYNGTLDVNSSWETFSGAYGIVPSTGWAFSSGGFNLKLNSDITAYTTSIMPRNTEHSFVLGNRVGGYDDVPGTVGVIGTHAYPSAATNLDGGAVVVSGGAAASASSGDADGGNVLLDGGLHYGTGDDGQIVIGNTRGSLRLKPRATIPIACAAGTEGTVYLDSDTHKPCYCNGTNYVLFSDDTTTCS